jgi:fructokinase
VAVDPNCRPSAIPDRAAYLARLVGVLRRADLVKVSTDDLAYLWPDQLAGVAARRILDLGPAAVLVTDGPGPVACHAPRFAFTVDVPATEVVDTVGAGDAFGGAFLARWIGRGFGRDELTDAAALRDAIVLAVEVARLTCRRPGADPPRRRELAWPPD